MADRFLEAGGTYFDTAYAYDSGESEKAFKAAIVDRYPRNQYTVATKLIAWTQCHNEANAKAQFFTSLERTGAGYFDFYLLHALQRNNYTKYLFLDLRLHEQKPCDAISVEFLETYSFQASLLKQRHRALY